MKLIGITGMSGAGKTTFSNMLAEKSNIGVVHIDDILTKIKLKYFSGLMSKDKEGKKTKVNSKLKTMLYGNKMLFNLFMRFRAQLINAPLLTEIERLQHEGKDIILIDDTFIKYQKIFDRLSMIFVVSRPYVDRKKAIKQRDNLTLKEVIAVDVAHHNGNYREIASRNNTIKIQNNGTKEDLRYKAEEIYKQYFVSFKNRYKSKATEQDRDIGMNIPNKRIDKRKDEGKEL